MRVLSAAVALAYGLAFVAVCLGGCLGVGTVEEHACCKQAESSASLEAASADCCKVISAVGSKQSAAAAPTIAQITYMAPLAVSLGAPPLWPQATLTASPPLVLRI